MTVLGRIRERRQLRRAQRQAVRRWRTQLSGLRREKASLERESARLIFAPDPRPALARHRGARALELRIHDLKQAGPDWPVRA